VGSTAFIAMSLRSLSLTSNAMNLGLLRFLGKYSYGIYIFQHIVGACANFTIAPILQAHTSSRFLIRIIMIVIVLSTTIGLSWLSYHFYEQRFLKLKKYFSDSTDQGVPDVTTSVVSSTV
jgi:peptidoglycan/LPS O-acetylase OafA/YrhL